MDSKLIQKLKQREEEGTLRSLSCFDGMIDFHSNDYLGLASLEISGNFKKKGSTGSRLISGTSDESLACEKILEDHFQVEGALFFNSGYDANLGFFSSVPQRGDIVLYDESIHASVRDGIRLSFAKAYSFKHNDVGDLKKHLSTVEGSIYVVIESLYSMNGDFAPLKEIAALCYEKGAFLIVDEAHSVGVFGYDGKGLVDEFNLADKVFARLVTFGKAYGSHGAAILGTAELKKYLYNFARSFIYTTALPDESYARVSQIIKRSDLQNRREALKENIALFRSEFKSSSLISDSNSPIQMLILGDVILTEKLAQNCQENGFAVKAIFSPTVPKGSEGIRISLHSTNKSEEVRKLCSVIAS
jgi:8-amino-7-oxononanoate synthase